MLLTCQYVSTTSIIFPVPVFVGISIPDVIVVVTFAFPVVSLILFAGTTTLNTPL